jgi:hypothetical protein
MGMNHRVKSVDKAVMNRTLGEVRDRERIMEPITLGIP